MDIFNAFDNIFGGHDYMSNGHSYHTQENIFGGENIYEDARLVAKTHENIFGGEDYYDDNNSLIATTKSNIFGGHDVYSDNNYEGSTHEGATGMNYTDYSGGHAYSMESAGNTTTILSYADPLAHIGSYIMPSLII